MKTLLPIGSVVRLQEGKKNVMIVGTYQQDETKTRYDYIAVVHPEGYINEDLFFLFNHENIEKVEFIGCVNAETQAYRQLVENEDIENINNK